MMTLRNMMASRQSVLIHPLLLAMGALLWAAADPALGATVKSVSAKKKTVTVDLDDGESFEKGAEVCVFDGDKSIDCGTVAKVKKKVMTVKMKSKKKLKKIKAGMTVAPSDGLGGAAEEAGGGGSSGAARGKMPFRILAGYAPALVSPVAYGKIGYEAPTSATPETLWRADGRVSQSLFGFFAQVAIPVGRFSLNPGLRYRTFTESIIQSDYIVGKQNPFAETTVNGSALGLLFDFQFVRSPLTPTLFMNLASGLEADSSTVKLTAKKKDDSGATAEGDLAKATSKLTVLSLRLASSFELALSKSFGLSAGLTLQVPLSEAGGSVSGGPVDGEAKGVAEPAADLKKQLGHKKNSFGAELMLGGGLSF